MQPDGGIFVKGTRARSVLRPQSPYKTPLRLPAAQLLLDSLHSSIAAAGISSHDVAPRACQNGIGDENVSPSRWQSLVAERWPGGESIGLSIASPGPCLHAEGRSMTHTSRGARRPLFQSSISKGVDIGEVKGETSALLRYSRQLEEVEQQIHFNNGDPKSTRQIQNQGPAAREMGRTNRPVLGVTSLAYINGGDGPPRLGSREPDNHRSSSALDLEAKRLLERVKMQLSGGVSSSVSSGATAPPFTAGRAWEPVSRWVAGGGAAKIKSNGARRQRHADGVAPIRKKPSSPHGSSSSASIRDNQGREASSAHAYSSVLPGYSSRPPPLAGHEAGILLPIEAMLEELELQSTMQRLLQVRGGSTLLHTRGWFGLLWGGYHWWDLLN